MKSLRILITWDVKKGGLLVWKWIVVTDTEDIATLRTVHN
jgi:hypothetical protein